MNRNTGRLFFLSPALAIGFLASVFVSCQRYSVDAFVARRTIHGSHFPLATSTSPQEAVVEENRKTLSEPPCYWKPTWKKGKWQRRIHLEDLKVGQKLQGTIVQELLEGKTGPKIYFDVGVGRTDSKGKWNIVTGMLRLDRAKQSVTKKRAARLRQKEAVELWVSRVQTGSGRLEVCLNEDDVKRYQGKPKVSITSLCVGDEVRGRVVRVLPYGVMVDIGANRLGLLHIGKVRDLYGKYINKEKGLTDAGLERGAQVRLRVEAIENRELSLDFTEDVKSEARAELEATTSKATRLESNYDGIQSDKRNLSVTQLAEWAEFAAISENTTEDVIGDEQVDSDEDDYDDYDEEREIEDSLGLGFY